MRILVGHNYYKTHGGEDAVAQTEVQILKDQGHEVEIFDRNNDELDRMSVFSKLNHLFSLDWSKDSYSQLRQRIKEYKPDIVHFHNIYFMLSPAVYYACQDEGVAVVQSLHNFRPLCSNGLFYRDNQVCEECLENGLKAGVKHKCFRDSKILTRFVVRMLEKHRKRKTWHEKIDRYITATNFTRQKYIQAGFPGEKIRIKPNTFNLTATPDSQDKGYALFLGRLSHEKGIDILLEAYKYDKNLSPLKVLGDGPLRHDVEDFVRLHALDHVELCGFVDEDTCREYMQGAKVIIIPSKCYENFPRVVVEAFGYGIPVVCSELGSLKEIIEDGKTGLFFKTGDSQDLAQKLKSLSTLDLDAMRQNVRTVYNEKYASKRNYEMLMAIYKEAQAYAKN